MTSNLPLTAVEIAKDVNMSESSIKHNMKNVKSVLSKAKVNLISSPGMGYWIEVKDNQFSKLENLLNTFRDKSYSFNYRRSYILDILFAKNAEYTIQLFADDLFVSRNVIVNDLNSIEKWLSYFDIKLVRKPNRGVKVKGIEFNLRQALIYSNTSLIDSMVLEFNREEVIDDRISEQFYNYFLTCYPECDIKYFNDLMLIVEANLKYKYVDVSFMQLLEYIALSASRINNGNVIKDENILSRSYFSQLHYQSAQTVLLELIPDESIQEYENETRCLAAQFSLYGTYEEAGYSLIKDEYYSYQARKFLEQLQEIIINKKILINESLIDDISLLFIKKKLQRSYQVTSSSYLVQDIKEQLASLYAVVLASIQPLENQINLRFSENDIAYLVILIDNALEDTLFEVKALFICACDYNTTTYLKNKIRRSIKEINITKSITPDRIIKENLNDYDLIISTIDLDLINAVIITLKIDDYDIELVNRQVQNKLREKKNLIIKKETWFREEFIILDHMAKRKEDVLRFGVDLLKEDGFVTEGFYKHLINQESFVSTALGNEIAIPHGYKANIKKSAVAVIQLRNPMEWNDIEKVKLVFIIAIAENGMSTL